MRHTGRTDIELTNNGREQARRLRRGLEGHDFTRVITSPLSRAVETCELAGLSEGWQGTTGKEPRERV